MSCTGLFKPQHSSPDRKVHSTGVRINKHLVVSEFFLQCSWGRTQGWTTTVPKLTGTCAVDPTGATGTQLGGDSEFGRQETWHNAADSVMGWRTASLNKGPDFNSDKGTRKAKNNRVFFWSQLLATRSTLLPVGHADSTQELSGSCFWSGFLVVPFVWRPLVLPLAAVGLLRTKPRADLTTEGGHKLQRANLNCTKEFYRVLFSEHRLSCRRNLPSAAWDPATQLCQVFYEVISNRDETEHVLRQWQNGHRWIW